MFLIPKVNQVQSYATRLYSDVVSYCQLFRNLFCKKTMNTLVSRRKFSISYFWPLRKRQFHKNLHKFKLINYLDYELDSSNTKSVLYLYICIYTYIRYFLLHYQIYFIYFHYQVHDVVEESFAVSRCLIIPFALLCLHCVNFLISLILFSCISNSQCSH